jgi:hypothetical protein
MPKRAKPDAPDLLMECAPPAGARRRLADRMGGRHHHGARSQRAAANAARRGHRHRVQSRAARPPHPAVAVWTRVQRSCRLHSRFCLYSVTMIPSTPALAASVAGMLVRAPVMQQSGELGLDGPAGRRVHPREVGWQGDPALRPDPALVAWDPLEPVPSLGTSRFLRRRHGTMNQSDSRPQLERRLRQCLATLPRRRPIRRTRSGLFGSDDGLPDMMRSTTPAERHRLA